MKSSRTKLAAIVAPPVGPSFVLSQVGALAARMFVERMVPLGLKPHHAGILRIVAHNPGVSQQVLSDALGVFASQLVLLLDGLERRGLIVRRANAADARSRALHLTAAGKRAALAIARETKVLEAGLFAHVSAKDVARLESLLRDVGVAVGATPSVHPAYREMRAAKRNKRAKK